MKTLALPVLAASVFALGACSEANAPTPTETDTVADETVLPAAEETPAVTEQPAEERGDTVSIDESGVEADIGDDKTRVRADVDGDPSLRVETD
ncbi:hypothetical protein V5F89_05770 [Pelagerythrobacter marensis]|uniref:Uncharacterized protein n=1 Tax=Pelagerythrobacter marensis TaxID=543877 RepID=A0ABZ2DB21_9SPHN